MKTKLTDETGLVGTASSSRQSGLRRYFNEPRQFSSPAGIGGALGETRPTLCGRPPTTFWPVDFNDGGLNLAVRMNRCTRHFTALMLALTLGLHWTVLQSVAWVSMLVNYSAESSFAEAVVKTFDGKHRCQICVAVDEGKQSEREQQKLKSLDKADWLFTECAVVLIRPGFTLAPVPGTLQLDSFGTSPPTPPPRTA